MPRLGLREGKLTLALTPLVFWRRKTKASPSRTVVSAAPQSEPTRTVAEGDAAKAREELRVLTLEREILGGALTTIYESETKGILTEKERDQLLGKYKADLKRLEENIGQRQRIVDLYGLETAREDLLKSFREKLDEINAKIEGLRPGSPSSPPTAPEKSGNTAARKSTETAAPEKEKAAREETKSKAEKRIEAIREEVLKAMERLEQIEAEG